MSSYSYTLQGPFAVGNNFTSVEATAIDQGAKDASTFKLDKDGSVANTGTQDFNRTLSGADKTFATFTATDGKQYSLLERNSDKALVFKNVTDNVILLELGPTAAAVKIAGGAPALVGSHSAGQTVISYGNGAPVALGVNEIYVQLT